MKNLVIVESPAKAKTIEKYLGKNYKVTATLGHIIDLPKNKLGVDIEKDYEPEFITIKGKGTTVKNLKKLLPKDDGEVFLAMDPDREGEAIAWHTAKALKLKNPKRITFHEITKEAVTNAIKTPTVINEDLVQAQLARRVLDRLVGYQVSELLWKKIWYGLSAGRVQSVALRLIVEREEEIEAFVPEEYWDIYADLEGDNLKVRAHLVKVNGKKYIPKNSEEAGEVVANVEGKRFKVAKIDSRESKKYPSPPFTTSTLQQAANNVLGFSSKRTMALAQVLYQAGYISYMRTDSVNLSQQALDSIRGLISSKYGDKYLPGKPNYYKNKARNAQEAHEAIRPTHFDVSSEQVKSAMGPAEAKLYDLIFKRAVASQMTPRVSQIMNVIFSVKGNNSKDYDFDLKAEKVLFDGFAKIMHLKDVKDEEFAEIEDIKEGQELENKEMIKEQKFTKPKARFTEATLVKTLEKYGIGRPSTYSTIISTVQERGYVVKESKYLKPLDVGRVVNTLMKKSFNRLVDYEYTAKVEGGLDDIADGKVKYLPFMDKEYKQLRAELDKALDGVSKEEIVILGPSEEKCPTCGSDMVVRLGRFGRFLSCSKFPECKGMKSLDPGLESLDFEKYHKPDKCPKCGKEMVLKSGKYGMFWACVDYPGTCKGVMPLLLNERCPECDSFLVERKGKWGKTFTGCSGYPNCKYIKKK